MLNEKIEKRNDSKIDRFGLFAKEKLFKNDLIWSPTENTVQKISAEEFNKLPKNERQIWIDHCYEIDDFLQMDVDDTRLMNHSCDPNTGDYPKHDPTMIIAIRDIQKDEEITWNYLPFMNSFQVFECNCGSKNCVGTVKKGVMVKNSF